MEKYIITTGKSIDLAIQAALKELNLDRDAVSVEVLENAKSGFLGIGACPAKVKVTYEVILGPLYRNHSRLAMFFSCIIFISCSGFNPLDAPGQKMI